MKIYKNRCFAIATILFTSSLCYGKGGLDGAGTDTYRTALNDARQVAVAAMEQLDEIRSVPQPLQEIYRHHRHAWIKAIREFKIERSEQILLDEGGDKRPKIALADADNQTVTLSVPYFESNPVSFTQLIIVAIHDGGHIARIPMTHNEFDDVGMAIAREKLVDYFGTSQLKRLETSGLSDYQRLKILYQYAPLPANLGDFVNKIFKYRAQSCVAILEKPLDNVGDRFPVFLATTTLSLVNSGPFLNSPSNLKILASHFTSDRDTLMQNPSYYESSSTARDYIFKGYYNILLPSDPWFEPGPQSHKWVTYNFRRSGDLISFKMEIEAHSKYLAYGYCWLNHTSR